MPLTASRTNRWASRAVVILQLATWNAIGIVLLQRGVSSLRRRMLETTSHGIETNSSIGLDVESTVSSMRGVENEYDFGVPIQRQLIDENARVIIRINPELPSEDNRNRSELRAINRVLKDAFKIVLEEDQFVPSPSGSPVISTTDREAPSSQIEDDLMEVNRHIDNPGGRSSWGRISRIARDKERIHNSITGAAKEDVTLPESVSEPVSTEKENRDAMTKYADHAEEGTPRQPSTQASLVREKTGEHVADTFWRSENRIRFSRINNGSAATAVAMVTIGVIMLLLGPAVIILRLFDERRRARQLAVLSSAAREDLPPSYEQAVFMSEAPRYSSLALNDDRSSPPPSPPSSLAYPNSAIKSHST